MSIAHLVAAVYCRRFRSFALADGKPPAVAFTVLAPLCGPKDNETEMGAGLFTKNCEKRAFNFAMCRIDEGDFED